MTDSAVPRALAIAGSDSGGGAGVQADLRAFARCGVHGMTAITAITAQSTVAVDAVEPVSGEMIVAQVRAVVDDIGVDAVKIGMLATAEVVEAVDRALDLLPAGVAIVLDPVMVAESGASLLGEDARDALIGRLLPRATVVTPNLPEAAALAAAADPAAAGPADRGADPESLGRAVLALGPSAVVVTGGHRAEAVDLYLDAETLETIGGQRHPDGGAHGSGCTHSSCLAALLARGLEPVAAARGARVLAGVAVRDGLRGIGAGSGPVDVLGLAGMPPSWA